MRLVLNSLHDEVAAKLRERIFDGVLAPGSFIDELGLCGEWAISRTPLREALKVLAAEGRVPSALVALFTKALVVAIEEYGKRKVGRRRRAAAAPATVF
eukprot:gene47443-63596_t